MSGEQAGRCGPVLGLQAMVNGLIPAPKGLICRGELNMKALFCFFPFNIEELFRQEVAEKSVELTFSAFQGANQRRTALLQFGQESFCLIGLK